MKAYIEGQFIELSEDEEAAIRKNIISYTAAVENRVAAIENAIADLALAQFGIGDDENA